MQVIVPVRQKPNFKRLDQILDTLSGHEHRRHYNQCTAVLRNSVGIVQTREWSGHYQ